MRPHPIDNRVDIGANESEYMGYVHIPDTAFLHALIDEGVDTDEDSLISYVEAEAVDSLFVGDKGIANLTGIEAFINLEFLLCQDNKLSALNVSENTALKVLYSARNDLSSVDVTNNTALEILAFDSNQMTSLDVSKNTKLTTLWTAMNPMTELDISNLTQLKRLFCYRSELDTLDISQNTALKRLDCDMNNLSEIDLSKNLKLTILVCGSNKLDRLDVSNNTKLELLHCAGNQLATLDLRFNTAIGSDPNFDIDLYLNDMPSLFEVCVWDSFHNEVAYEKIGSPNVCFQTDCNGDCSFVGFKESSQLGLSIYPNPATDLLTIETTIPGQHTIEIHSLNGQLLYKTKGEGPTLQIDLSSFQKGLYFITVGTRDYVRTDKIIKL